MNTIEILGKPYKLIRVKTHDLRGDLGSVNCSMQEIRVAIDQGKEQQKDTLFHEIIHVISSELGLHLKESTIRAIGCGLASCKEISFSGPIKQKEL
jgi:hypothetical protein